MSMVFLVTGEPDCFHARWRPAIVLNPDRDARTKYQKAIKPGIFSTKDTTPSRVNIFCEEHQSSVHRRSIVGASLLAKAVGQLASVLNMPPPSRASSLPHWISCEYKTCTRPKSPVGASLLAKAVGQLASVLNMPPPSRASSLPHWISCEYKTCTRPKSLWERACSR